MSYDTIIRGGTLITPTGQVEADLAIEGETIAAVGHHLAAAPETRVIDATGKLVIPGGIDPHVHLQMPAGAVTSSDDWHTGTVAAACGGTTTVIDFVEPEGAPLLGALAARRAEAEGAPSGDGGAVVDFGLRMTLMDGQPETLAQIPAVVAAGVTSFKTYLTYDGFKLSDAEFLRALEAVAAAGGIALVHAENDAIVSHLKARFLAEGRSEPRWHPHSRPTAAEGEAVERALALAEIAGCPLYVVHVSTERGRAAVARARARGQRAWGETCPQYLLLTAVEYERPGFEGAKFVCSPPLRSDIDCSALWDGLISADLSVVGTDHCPFFFEGQKDLGLAPDDYPPFARIPGGLPGIESRLALVYSFGVARGLMSVERWVEVCCAAPAHIFGLTGRKGALQVGADADVVVFDPSREITLAWAMLHENCDYTPYEGMRLAGYPTLTMLRGSVIAQDGQFVGARAGRYLRTDLTDLADLAGRLTGGAW
jgi:dihydropyrimidinase